MKVQIRLMNGHMGLTIFCVCVCARALSCVHVCVCVSPSNSNTTTVISQCCFSDYIGQGAPINMCT